MSNSTENGKKGRKKRESTKYPNLKVNVNLKTRYEEVEDVASYINKLSDSDKAWMDKFMGEYNNASLDVQNLDNNLHNTQELKKACQDKNNARNRCIYSRAKASGNLTSIDISIGSKNNSLINDEIDNNQVESEESNED